MRRRSLKPHQPLLVGRLVAVDNGRRMDPTLCLKVWCPYCKSLHIHGWWPDVASDLVGHRGAHCDGYGSPLSKDGYHIGLDPHPSLKAEHKREAEKYRQIVTRNARLAPIPLAD